MGRYAAQSDVEAVFGTANVAVWSNLDSDSTTANTSRIASAIAVAEQSIDDRLRGGPYSLPLTAVGSGGLVTVTDWAARLAGVWLYESRGVEDETANQIAAHKKMVHGEIDAYMAGTRRLDCLRSGSIGMHAPMIIW